MSDLFVALATVVPALFFGASGVALLPTRSRMAGALMVVTAVGVITSAMLRIGDESDAARVLLVVSLMLPGAMALLAFPRATFRHAVEFCAWIVVVAAGVVGIVLHAAFRRGAHRVLGGSHLHRVGRARLVGPRDRGRGGSPGDALAGTGRHRHRFDLRTPPRAVPDSWRRSPEDSFSPHWGRPWRWGSVAPASPTSVRWSSGPSSSVSSRSPTLLSSSVSSRSSTAGRGARRPRESSRSWGCCSPPGFIP